VESLKDTIKALEAKLKAAGERKVEVVVKEEKKEERKPEPKKPEEKKPDGERRPEGDRRPEGPGGFGPPWAGGSGPPPWAGGGMNPGGRGFGGGQPGTPPGFDKLTKDEQAMFRKLMEKMGGPGQPDRRPEGGDRRPTPTPERREGGDRKPSMEERMEKLERAIEEIRRGLQGPMGRGGR
jgi:hypothetical protein